MPASLLPFRSLILCSLLGLWVGLAESGVSSQQVLGSSPLTSTHHVQDKLGAVASESTICSRIGIDVLKSGGNAADAMIATTFCVGVIGMYHSGIGGGGFLLVRSSSGSYENVDFRESAPATAFQDMYENNTEASVSGGLASGVPGEVRGMEYLHKHYGSLPWEQLVRPAVRVARDGFPVTEDLFRIMDFAATIDNDFLTTDPNWAIDFAPNGTRLGLGETITRKRYADTLEIIAEQGADVFYNGPLAESMVNAVQAANGTMTLEDLKDYHVAIRPPVNINYRGYNVTSCSAPASGAVVLSAMKTLEGYDDFGPEKLNLSTHRLTEAMRFAYGERTHIGDPFFVDCMDQYQSEMTNSTTASITRSKISDYHTLNVSAYDPEGLESRDTPGTSHVVTADASGMAVTMTTTLNLIFGSRVMSPETGIIMNDEMNDFSIPGFSNAFGYIPSPANFIRPGKRPLSSITPTIVESANGALYFVTGAAGGSRIITATLVSLINVLDYHQTAPQALAEPRLHNQLIPNNVVAEDSFDNSTLAFLKDRGHNVTWIRSAQSSAQAIRILPNGTFEAAGEPRQQNSGGFAV